MFDISPKAEVHLFISLFFLYQILRVARQFGDFLLVGVHADQTVRYNSHPFHNSLSGISINNILCFFVKFL